MSMATIIFSSLYEFHIVSVVAKVVDPLQGLGNII